MAATWVGCFLASLLAVAAFILLRIVLRIVGAVFVLWLLLFAVAHAAPACQGQTFGDDFSQGFGQWVFGEHDSLSSGNGGFASYQSPTQNDTETSGPNGATLSVLPEPGPNGEQWQAGLISTKQYQTYGVFQATVNINPSIEQPGMSWSFWMLGNQHLPDSAQGWPIEFDAAEQYGATFDSAVHSGFMSGAESDAAANNVYGFPSGQHTFTIDWEPDTTTFYIDGKETRQVATPADAHVPMMMVLGTAATDPIHQPWTSAPAPGASGSVNILSVRAFDNMRDANACGNPSARPMVATTKPSQTTLPQPTTIQTPDPPTPDETLQVGSTIQLQGAVSAASGPLQNGLTMCNDPATRAANQKLCSDLLAADGQLQQAQSQIDPNQANLVQSDLSGIPQNGTSTSAIDARIAAALQQLGTAGQQ